MFDTRQLSEEPDDLAPDGSEIRLLGELEDRLVKE